MNIGFQFDVRPLTLPAAGEREYGIRWYFPLLLVGTSTNTSSGLLPFFHTLPHFFDGQAVTQLAIVVPLVAVYFPLERVGVALDGLKILAHAILRRPLVRVPVQRVMTACRPKHLAVLVISDPHKLCRCDVLEHRSSFGKRELLAAVLAGN